MALNFCGIDCGFTGGISIILGNDLDNPIVYKMPVIKEVKKVKGKNKTKQFYDLLEIRKIFKNHLSKNSIIFVEKVSNMPGEGSSSTFSFAKGFGNMEGLIVGTFGNLPVLITPQSWKKYFPELITNEMRGIKAEMKELRLAGKKIKGKEAKKENKKHIDKLGRQFKSLAKTEARMLVSKLYPSISDRFVKKNTDGMAESLLIALYGKNKGQSK
jgi:hypothetical protein